GDEKPDTKGVTPSATVSQIDELFTARSWGQHPRILANSEDFNRIRKDLETDPYLQTWYARIYQYCVAQLSEPVVEYQIPDGVRLLSVSRLASYRITWMAFLYQINGEQRFAQRAVEELLQVCSFSDWNPSHYLDVAQMCYGVGIGYDWLYHYMSDAQRKTVSKALYNLAISQQQDQTKSTYLRTNSNWNPWCNAGLSVAACAVYESYPSQCSFILSKAVTNVQSHNATLTPAGSYAEGPGYYQLGAGFMVILMETMRSVLGTDFGLSDMEGIKESGRYLLAMNGYSNTFNFGDGNASLMDGALLHWYANRFNMPELSLYQRSMQSTSVMYDEYLAMIWYSPALVEGMSLNERQPDHFLLSDEYESIASFRGFGGDATQIYTAMKSGMNNNSHTDLDVGDFVLEALGERWITEMGSDNYNLPGYSSRLEDSKRWTYYRKRAEGQNTLVVNPDATGGQAFNAKCQIVSYESAYDGGYAVVDMLDAYDNYGVTQGKRALTLFDNRSRVLLRDELKCKTASTVYWFAHTQAEISISADGKTAELTQNGKKLIAQIAEPSNATFTSMTADPLSTSPASVSGENSREGFRKLAICLKNVTNVNISVVFTPVLEEGDRNKTLPTTTIANLKTLLNAYEPGTTLKTNSDGVYEIYDTEDLMCFASMVNSGTSFYGKQVRLMDDIDLKGRTFAPIGGSGTSNSFRGTFDGNGHVVKNLFINQSGVGSTAFFGRTSGATIKNFGIESGTIYCGDKSGGLTGLSSSITIEKCFNKAKVISSAGQCGGLVGQIGGTNTITDSYNYADIRSTAGIAGGIVGYAASNTDMTLTNCYHMGELSDSLGRCGLIGFYNTTAENLLVTKVTVNNCYATTAIKSSAVTDNGTLESYTNCSKLSVAEMPAMAVTLGSSFVYDCEYENANAPVLAWQCDTTLPKDLVIQTAAQLRLFAYKVNTGTTYSGKTVRLGNNIDLDSVEWIPIGGNTAANGSKGKIFKGTFDGQGYSISNLSVTANRFYVGFFGSVQGTVRNLGIRSGRVIGEKKVAGLAGYFSGTMENCYNRAAVTGGSHTGGLIGSPDALTMANCYNMGTVEAELVGGGLMGWLSESSTGSVIRNCYNGGSVSGSTVGSLAVSASGTDIQFINCHALTGIALMGDTTGCTLTDCTRLSADDLKVAYTTLGEGFVADNYFPSNGGYPILLRSVYVGEPLPTLTPNGEGIYEIHTARDLRALSYMVNVGKKTFSKETVLLCADIDLGHEEFVPIGGNIGVEGQAKGTFSGTFDGGGHRIYNMDITTGNLYVGLFGFASSATIQNVGIESGTVIGSDKVGAILGSGRNYTKIINCYNRATVSSRTAIGGIVGMLASSGCRVQNCYNAGSVSGNNTVGGIVGYFASDAKDALIENCYNRSDVAGGIVGSVNAAVTTAEIRNCYTLDTTALAGSPANLIVTNCGQITPKDLRDYAPALGEGYDEDYFVQNKLFPVLDWENAGRKTTLTKESGVYEIRTADDLRLVSYMVRNGENFSGDTLEMRADIDLEGKAWTPIGGADESSSYQFRGTFDGRGYRIYNLKSNESDYGYGGLFGSINTGTIRNLGIESGMVVGSKRTAAIAGYVGGGSMISNCYNKATVYAPTNIGSFVGYLTGKDICIENCYNVGMISSKSYGTTVGGLIGGISSSTTGLRIKNCYSIGYYYALIGTMMGKEEADCVVENCYAVDGVNLIRLQEKLQFVNSGIIAADELRAYASVLGSAYEDDTKGINNGYPILTWESGSVCYHNYGTGVITAPTCTVDGYTTFTCSRCGHSYEDKVVKATGHSYEGSVTKAPTFTAKGTMTYTCKNDKTHTYTEDVDVLRKSLFFDFDNSKAAQERYQNYVYNFVNFDTPEAWRGRTQGLKNGNLSMDTATSTITVTPKVTGFNSIYADSVNLDLNYDPEYAEYFQMRFKVTGLVGTKPKASVHFYYSTDNSYLAATAVPVDVSYLSSGEYIVVTGQIQDAVRELEEVNRVILHLTGFTAEEDLDAVLTFDYAFVGPYEELPTKTSLFFDFTDKEADRIRYNSRTYGYTNFDDLSKLNWSYPTSGVSALIADSANDTVTIQAKGTFNASSWPAVYMDTYDAGNKNAYPLHFDPSEAEYFQVRFKMKNFRIGETETTNEDGSVTTNVVNPYLKISYTETGSTTSTSGTRDYKDHAAYINSDNWIVATVPLNSAFKSATEITRLRLYFGGIESISETLVGEIAVDYIFVGKFADLPTPAYTVTFVDDSGKTLATQLVNRGESATYTGKTPTKASDATNHYTYKGWDKALTNITADTTITATFTGEAHSYTYATTDTANHKGTCSCGYSKSEGHSYEYKATKNPTTSATGTLTGTCSACSGTATITLPELNTTDYTKTTTKAPTCTATGTDKYTWKTTTYGTFFFNVTTKAKGHTEVIDKAVAPTCTATGLTEGKHCSVCNAVLTAQETVSALGHAYNNVVTAPTCTAEGYTTHTCSRCSDSYVDTKVSATGHSYDSGIVTKEPTFTEEGILTYTCKNDQSHTYTEDMDTLSKSLFFDFDNSDEAQERYQNYVYNYKNFDTPEAWRGRTQGLREGNLTIDTATSSVTVTPKVTGFNSIYADSVNFDLNYNPEYAEYFQMRFKVTGLIGTKPKASVHFYYSTDNSYVIGKAVPFDVSYLSSGEYIVITGQLQDEIRQL
ncbi:MAG: heparinase II/III family protein, partial [Oscillospiraceae bacterium]|nr:heparinase II/III family protein [Oscillospiraceae bacterium]